MMGQVVTATVTVQITKKKRQGRGAATWTPTANNYKFRKLITATITSCHMLENDGQTMLVRLKGDCFTVHFLCVTFHFSLLNSEKTAGRLTVLGRTAPAMLMKGACSFSQSLSL